VIELERTHNEEAMHIPIGLYSDLIDPSVAPNNEPLESFLANSNNNPIFVTDHVDAFTITNLFSLLDGGTQSMTIYKDRLEVTLLPSTTNTQTEIDNLFFDYGL